MNHQSSAIKRTFVQGQDPVVKVSCIREDTLSTMFRIRALSSQHDSAILEFVRANLLTPIY